MPASLELSNLNALSSPNLFFTNLHMLDYFVNFAKSWFSNVKRNEETKFCSESIIRQRV